MHIKVRPAIWILSIGLVLALIGVVYAIIMAVRSEAEEYLLTAVIAFGGTITTVLGTSLAKLVESEEKGD